MTRSLFSSFSFLSFSIVSALTLAGPGQMALAGGTTGKSIVTFVATDHRFAGPDRISAGVTTMQVINRGHDLHHIQLLKLAPGKTADDFRAAIAADASRFPAWVTFVGGPNAVIPGQEAAATMMLAEGDYLLICLIPSEQGVPHVALGMQKPLAVKGGKATVISRPNADITITTSDFHFRQSQPISAGTHTFEVVNRGTQAHEVVLVKLDAGVTARDFGAAVEPRTSTPPPGMPIGGVVGIEPGDQAFFTARFEPGHYGLICFFPDSVTGKPHFMHGMTADFVVQ